MDAVMEIIGLNKELIGTRIKEARERAGLEQSDLGKLIGLSQAGVSKLENGKALTLENIFGISEVLNCSVAGLLGIGTDELNPKEVRLIELVRALPDHQDAILSILEGMNIKYGAKNGKR